MRLPTFHRIRCLILCSCVILLAAGLIQAASADDPATLIRLLGLWATDLNELGLQFDHPTETPVLPLIYRSHGSGGIKTALAHLDVRTGRILHQEIFKSASSRETRTKCDPAKGEVRVETSFRDHTIRLTDEPADAPIVTDQPPP